MDVTADTNILLRMAVRDDLVQANAAAKLLQNADRVVITNQTLCEFVWVLRRAYSLSKNDVLVALEGLLSGPNVVIDRFVVQAGLATLRAGGDFADGVIAQDGRRSGGTVFASFDKQAIRLLQAQGFEARLP